MALRRTNQNLGKSYPGRQAQKEATKARILDVARRHFERDGFAAANIRAIAGEASVAPGTILLHFTDKLGLLHAALHDDLDSAIQSSLNTPSRGPLLRRLSVLVRPFYAYYAARPHLSKTLLKESLLAESPWRERFAEQVMRVTSRVVVLLEAAKAAGEIAPTTPADLFAIAFSSFYYLALIGWVQGGVPDPLSLFNKLMEQHIEGCSAKR